MPTFWEAYDLLKQNTMAMICRDRQAIWNTTPFSGMIFGLDDQFTSFISPDAAKLINENATGSFSGIGAGVQLNKGRALQIMKVFPIRRPKRPG